MSIESWFVLTVAAAFLLLGIAGSPLAWVALHHRKSQLEKLMEERWNELTAELRRLEGRLALAEGAGQSATANARAWARTRTGQMAGALPGQAVPLKLATKRRCPRSAGYDDTSLISVPNLASAPDDRDHSSSRSLSVMPRSGPSRTRERPPM